MERWHPAGKHGRHTKFRSPMGGLTSGNPTGNPVFHYLIEVRSFLPLFVPAVYIDELIRGYHRRDKYPHFVRYIPPPRHRPERNITVFLPPHRPVRMAKHRRQSPLYSALPKIPVRQSPYPSPDFVHGIPSAAKTVRRRINIAGRIMDEYPLFTPCASSLKLLPILP